MSKVVCLGKKKKNGRDEKKKGDSCVTDRQMCTTKNIYEWLIDPHEEDFLLPRPTSQGKQTTGSASEQHPWSK